MLGAEQETWFAKGMKRASAHWNLVVQQTLMAEVDRGRDVQRTYWADGWDGYPAARDRLLKASLEASANLVVLSGDSHNAWAFDLDRKGTRVGVEMAGQGVTSPGAEDSLPWVKPDELARDSVAANRQLKWCDTSRRGYMAVELTPRAATSEWRFMASVRQKGTALAGVKRMTVLAGQRKYSA